MHLAHELEHAGVRVDIHVREVLESNPIHVLPGDHNSIARWQHVRIELEIEDTCRGRWGREGDTFSMTRNRTQAQSKKQTQSRHKSIDNYTSSIHAFNHFAKRQRKARNLHIGTTYRLREACALTVGNVAPLEHWPSPSDSVISVNVLASRFREPSARNFLHTGVETAHKLHRERSFTGHARPAAVLVLAALASTVARIPSIVRLRNESVWQGLGGKEAAAARLCIPHRTHVGAKAFGRAACERDYAEGKVRLSRAWFGAPSSTPGLDESLHHTRIPCAVGVRATRSRASTLASVTLRVAVRIVAL
jgi:hypothetical protein